MADVAAAPAAAAPAAAPAAPAAASLSDFDSLVGGMETPIPGSEVAEQPAQRQQLDDPADTTDEPVEQAEGETSQDDDGLLEDEAAASAPEALTAAAEKWQQLEDSPELPADLGQKLWTVKPNGREEKVTIEELGKGYMRLNESTRRAQELDGREQQIAAAEQRFEGFFKSIEDPHNFLEVFERKLGPQVLDKALEIRQERMNADVELIEAAGYAVMRRHQVDKNDPRVRQAMLATKARIQRERELDIEKRRLEARTRDLEARHQEVDTSKRVAELRATFERQLAQLVPTAFKASRIRDTPVNRDRHTDYIKRLAKARGAREITRELVMEAATCLRQDLEDERASRVKQPAAATKAQPSASKGAGGGTAPTRGHVSNGAKSLKDWDDHFGV